MYGKWIKATELPKEYEGKRAWQYPITGWSKPSQVYIPRDYDRRPEACGDVHFMLIEEPKVPDTPHLWAPK